MARRCEIWVPQYCPMKLFSTALLLCCCFSLSAQEHFYDFIYLGQGSNPSFFYSNDDYVLFTAETSTYGKELYVSDGTEAGTILLKDVSPGTGNTAFTHFTEHGDRTFFLAYTSLGYASLWYTDGTPEGTKEFYRSAYNREIDLGTFNDYLFYQAQTGDDTYTVRRVSEDLSDDVLVASHSHGHQYSKSNFATTENYIFYGFNDQIYRVDKTFGSPEKYFERSTSGAGDVPYLYAHNNTIMWPMRTTGLKTTIYAGKETIGSHKEVDELYGYVSVRDYVGVGNFLYYTTGQLYRLNVNNLTQEEVRSTSDQYVAQAVSDIGLYKGQVYFSGVTSGDWELWRTGNSNSATVRIANIASDTSSHPQDFYVVDDELYFSAYTRDAGRELWKTDGSNANTKLLTDLVPGPRSSEMGLHGTAFKNELFVSAATDSFGMELWKTDGTEANTELVANVNQEVNYGDQRVSTFMKAGDYLYMFANDSIHNTELWRTDGTEEGTIFLDDINPDRLPGSFGEHTEYKGRLYGTAVSFLDGVELYRSTGTPNGSFFVTPSDILNSTGPNRFFQLGANLYYLGGEGFLNGSTTLYISDGSKDGTKPLYKGKGKTYKEVENLYRVGDYLFFSAEINNTGQEPFISDGTYEGTTQISDIAPNGSSEPNYFCGSNQAVFFSAMDDNGLHGIYKTNAEDSDPEASLEISFQLEGLASDFAPDTVFIYQEQLLFVAFDVNYRKRLYSYDPSTQNLTEVTTDATNISDLKEFVELNGLLLFLGKHGTAGEELMVTDGTTDNTLLLKDILAGSRSSEVEHLTVYNGLAFFSATSADKGKELWMTDGTVDGTQLLWDIYDGSTSSDIRDIVGYKGMLYVAASDGTRQGSLFRLVVNACHALAPELKTASGLSTFCEGADVVLEASTGIYNDADITWYKDEKPLSASGYSLNITEEGDYYVVAQKDGCEERTKSLSIVSVPAPAARIVFEGDSAFCEGDKTVLKLEGDAELKIQWYKDGAPFGNTLQIGSKEESEYYATVSNSYGCETTTNTVSTEVYPLPNPQITLRDDTLFCNLNVDNYQWFFKGGPIGGADQKFLVPDEEGAYRVDVVNQKGCTGSSAGYRYEKIGIEESSLARFVYPNPSSGVLYLNLPESEGAIISLYDVRGKTVLTQELSQQLDLSAYQDGMYLLVVQQNGNYQSMRIVKQAQ